MPLCCDCWHSQRNTRAACSTDEAEKDMRQALQAFGFLCLASQVVQHLYTTRSTLQDSNLLWRHALGLVSGQCIALCSELGPIRAAQSCCCCRGGGRAQAQQRARGTWNGARAGGRAETGRRARQPAPGGRFVSATGLCGSATTLIIPPVM